MNMLKVSCKQAHAIIIIIIIIIILRILSHYCWLIRFIICYWSFEDVDNEGAAKRQFTFRNV